MTTESQKQVAVKSTDIAETAYRGCVIVHSACGWKTTSAARWRVVAVVLLAGVLPWLLSVGAHSFFGGGRHVNVPLHECLELTGACIALAVAMLLWLQVRHEEGSPHLLWVVLALVAMGVVDGAHAVAPFGIAWSWLRHSATLLGGLVFALVWVPLPSGAIRRKQGFVLVVAGLAVGSALAIWWRPDLLPLPWGPTGYTVWAKAANFIGGLGFMTAAAFFFRRYLRQPQTEDLVFASHTVLFGTASLLFWVSHLWGPYWWAWHVFRLLAYGIVLVAAYKLMILLYQRATHLAAIVESSDDAIISKSLDGVIDTWNRAAERLYGYSAAEAIGQPINLIIPPELQEEMKDLLRRVGRGERIENHDTVRLRKDGSRVPVSLTLSSLRDPEGTITGASVISRDITDRMQAAEALRKASLYTRSLLEASLDPLVTISREGKITDVNQAAELATGVARDRLIGSDFCDYFTDPDKARQGYKEVFAGGFVRDYPLAIRHTSGQVTHVLYNASVFRNEQGEIEGVFAAARDVTDRKRAEDEVRKLNEELEERVAARTEELRGVNKELEAFNYAVAHDLRAPLRHIHGFAEILFEEATTVLDESAKRHLDMIRDSVQHMEQLLNDLLSLSRLGRQEVSKQVCGLNAVVEEVVNALKPEVKERQVEWRIAELPFLECDPSLMKQVIMNLLSNALKFTRPRQPAIIEIGQQTVDGEPVVFVRDNGVGFSMAYVDKLFGLFQRLHRQQDFEGTGVGLAIVQRIINKHGGKVWGEGELNKGATFYFTLHCSAIEPGAQPTKQEVAYIAQ